MDASEFSKKLDQALGLCRAAAELNLPIEAMLEHAPEHLYEIVAAVGEVAAIGAALPPAAPDLAALPCPLPANLRRA